MAKSNLKLLQEAIDDGDLEMAKILMAKIEGKKKRNEVVEPDEESSPSGWRSTKKEEEKPHKFKNNYKPPRGPSKFDKVDQILAQQDINVSRRPPVKKVKMVCDRCGKADQVYPREIQVSYDELGKRFQFYRCNSCAGGR